MNLQEKQIMLENIISEISSKGHDDVLLQQLMSCYLDIYLAKVCEELGRFIDAFQNADEELCSDFFGQIIKPGKYTDINDGALGSLFANRFLSSLVQSIIRKNESLNQIYTSLGVLCNTNESANFWWSRITTSLAGFDFEDLCQIVPNMNLTDGILQILMMRESDLRALLSEKGISEEDYSISYGTIYGNGAITDSEEFNSIWRDELEIQKRAGLYLRRQK